MEEIDQDDTELKKFRKTIEAAEKDGQKYIIFVVALPLVGAIGLSILGALNYNNNFPFGSMNEVIKTESIESQGLEG